MVKDEGINDPDKFTKNPGLIKEKIERAINYVLKKIDENIIIFRDKFPSPASSGNI